MDEDDFKAAIRTFQAVFPDTTMWFSGGEVLLVGGTGPLTVDPTTFLTRTAKATIAKSLREIEIADGATLLGFFMLDRDRARDYAGGSGPLHTDNYPLLEFSAPKTLYRESAPQILTALRRLAGRSALPLARTEGRELAPMYETIAREKLLLKMPEAALMALANAPRSGGGAAPDLRRL